MLDTLSPFKAAIPRKIIRPFDYIAVKLSVYIAKRIFCFFRIVKRIHITAFSRIGVLAKLYYKQACTDINSEHLICIKLKNITRDKFYVCTFHFYKNISQTLKSNKTHRHLLYRNCLKIVYLSNYRPLLWFLRQGLTM